MATQRRTLASPLHTTRDCRLRPSRFPVKSCHSVASKRRQLAQCWRSYVQRCASPATALLHTVPRTSLHGAEGAAAQASHLSSEKCIDNGNVKGNQLPHGRGHCSHNHHSETKSVRLASGSRMPLGKKTETCRSTSVRRSCALGPNSLLRFAPERKKQRRRQSQAQPRCPRFRPPCSHTPKTRDASRPYSSAPCGSDGSVTAATSFCR